MIFEQIKTGADLGRAGRTPPPSGIRPPADPKDLPFDTFSEIHFWPTDPKIFLKAPLAPIYTNFEWERAPKKKREFLAKFFKKCPKTAFLTVFSKICLRRRKFCKNRGKTVLWESSKNQFGRPKKKVVKILENFSKIRPPPLEKILDPPLDQNEQIHWNRIVAKPLFSEKKNKIFEVFFAGDFWTMILKNFKSLLSLRLSLEKIKGSY